MTEKEFQQKQANVNDETLIETVQTKLAELCKTHGRILSMSIPPKVSDFDMAVCELIRRYIKQKDLLKILLEKNMCSHYGDELIKKVLND